MNPIVGLGTGLRRAADGIDRILGPACGLGLLAAALVLCDSVFVRYVLHRSTDWQDETAVFLLVGVTFLSTGQVQSVRGHIGIDALSAVQSPRANRIRRWATDLAGLIFIGFFTIKSWALTKDAWDDGLVTSSTFGPPLWIPYVMMSVGMTLLTLRLIVQLIDPRDPPQPGAH